MDCIWYKFSCQEYYTPVFNEIITEAFIKPILKMKYRKKPVVIDAIQRTGHNSTEIMLFVGQRLKCTSVPHQVEREHDDIPNSAYTIEIPTLEGVMTANKLDWIIKGVNGEYYPCKPDIFEKTYELV